MFAPSARFSSSATSTRPKIRLRFITARIAQKPGAAKLQPVDRSPKPECRPPAAQALAGKKKPEIRRPKEIFRHSEKVRVRACRHWLNWVSGIRTLG